MATNVPYTDPQILYESPELAEAFGKRILSPTQLRNEESLAEIREGKVSK